MAKPRIRSSTFTRRYSPGSRTVLLVWLGLGACTLRCGVNERLPPGDTHTGGRSPTQGGETNQAGDDSQQTPPDGGAAPSAGGNANEAGQAGADAGPLPAAGGAGGQVESNAGSAGLNDAGSAGAPEAGSGGTSSGGTTGSGTAGLGGTLNTQGGTGGVSAGGASTSGGTPASGGTSSSGGVSPSGGTIASGGRTLSTGGRTLATGGIEDDWTGGRPPACFIAGTLVTLANGTTLPIQDIRVDDEVLSYDPATRAFVRGRVSQLFIHPHTPVLIDIDGRVTTTPEHPFFVEGTFRPAGALDLNRDKLFELPDIQATARAGLASELRGEALSGLAAPHAHPLVSLTMLSADVTTYNLEVVPSHTYFAAGFLVHNKPPVPQEP